MAYDEELADRVREQLAERADVTETRMFGGLAFMVAGHMTVAASRTGGLLARVDPADAERLMATTDAEPMEMGGRSMAGWLRVPAGSVRTKAQLTKWIKLATTYVATLPPKAPKSSRHRVR